MKRGLLLICLSACSPSASPEGIESGVVEESGADVMTMMSMDAGADSSATDAADGACFLSKVGVFGQCVTTAQCMALGKHIATPGYCSGPADIECCTLAPNVADNPPVPAGWKLMKQAMVTADMTTWAVDILHDPVGHPMFSTDMKTFGALLVLARVEWHPPDFQNSAIHRGVTLYVQ